MGVKVKNNAYGVLLLSITASDTSITLQTGEGANFPSLTSGEYFYATLIDASQNLEIVKVTARTGDVLTVLRGQEGTTARVYVVGDRIEQRITAALLNEKANKAGETFTGMVIDDHIDFDTTASTGQEKRLKWNDIDGTLDLGLKGGNVTLQIGQELVQRIYNDTGSALLDMQAVYITGSTSARMTVALARADAESTSSKTFGIVTKSISTGTEGYVTTYGYVRNVDTSGFPEGAALWLSPTVAGGITHIKPSAPNHLVLMGFCVFSHATEGVVYVHVQNGYELDELHSVYIATPQNLDYLRYNAGTGLWENAQGLDTTNNSIRIRGTRTPASSTATGEQGTICWDASYIYVCVATNSWIRFAKATSSW